MKYCKLISVAIAFVLSTNVHAALISTLESFSNTAGLIAGDQSTIAINDWATASVFHVGTRNIIVEKMTAVFGSTDENTSKYLEIGVYESTGIHGVDLAPGALIGAFDTSIIDSNQTNLSIDLTAIRSFELQSNTDYLLVWNAQPGAPYLGTKRTGTPDQMVNNGIAGFFTGEVMSSQNGGSSWFSVNQRGFDYASLDGTVSAKAAVLSNINVSTVPVPAAVWLFSSGLLGLTGVARRKKAA
ncbi:MAG: VPLPA-CTERM sorting domain-containing protein [Gammaproteobacteria bacterium]